MQNDLKLQEWISRISDDDRKRVAHTFRFDAHPSEFLELFNELRQRYDFIPQPIPNERTDAVESVLNQLSELVTTLSLDEMMFLTRNSVAYNRLSSTFRASFRALEETYHAE